MKLLTFNKEKDGRWYVDLPTWDGDKSELEMVLGADTMLDIISQGDEEVHLFISEEPFDHTFELSFVKEEYEGASYVLSSELYNFNVWLCHVTKFVFEHFPQKIYIK